MAKFLNSSGITYYLENLIKNAETHLVFISPYIKFNLRIKQLLDERNSFKFNTTLIYGKTDLQTEESDWLKSKEFIKVKFCENLHAKCYINEKEAIITSMNLYDFSQQNNNEMGIYVNKNDSSELYNDIEKEVDRLIRISELISDSIEKIELKEKTYAKGFSKNYTGKDIKISDIKAGNDVNLTVKVVSLFGVRKFNYSNGSIGIVGNIKVANATGEIHVVLWGDKAELIESGKIKNGNIYQIQGYAKYAKNGSGIEIDIGRTGTITEIKKNIVDVDTKTTHKKLKKDINHDKADTDLFGKLKSLRSQIAHKKNVPAYYIFNDSSLIEMTLHLPKNKKEFLKINGVGQQKLNDYGEIFLDVINK